jgi:flagellin-like protein
MEKRLLVLKRDEEGVSPVIATILMVAITVVLAAVLYVMVSGLIIIDGDPPRMTVVSQGTGLGCSATSCKGKIADITRAEELAKFKVVVLANDTALGSAQTLQAGDIAFGSVTFRFTDVGGEGDLGGGDLFELSGLAAETDYKVAWLWANGNDQVADALFST